MAKLRPDQEFHIQEINDRWEQPQKISRFGNGIKNLFEQAMWDMAYLIEVIGSLEDENEDR